MRTPPIGMLFACLALPAAAPAGGCVKALAPCPDRPNCVATGDPRPARRAPALRVRGTPEAAWRALRELVLGMPRTVLVADDEGYLHATVASAVWGFVDDLEVTACDAGRTLAMRSAARRGYWDLGVNARRVNRLAARLRAAGVVE